MHNIAFQRVKIFGQKYSFEDMDEKKISNVLQCVTLIKHKYIGLFQVKHFNLARYHICHLKRALQTLLYPYALRVESNYS